MSAPKDVKLRLQQQSTHARARYIKERILPLITEWKRNFYVLYKRSSMLDELGDFIKELHPKDKPSEKLNEYLKTRKLEEKMLELENHVE